MVRPRGGQHAIVAVPCCISAIEIGRSSVELLFEYLSVAGRGGWRLLRCKKALERGFASF
jgi:hypothetical protein